MPGMGKHAPRRDHLWVLAIIAGFAFYDVWVAWTQLGNESGFRHGTGWTLTVIVELYWGYALYAWLAAAPGPRSRKFAMRSAIGVFALSLAGQGLSYLAVGRTPPVGVVVFVHLLPVTVLALLAFLIHFRHLDRTEAATAERRAAAERERITTEATVADDRTALRAELSALQEKMRAAETARGEAQRRETETLTRADSLAKKLAVKTAQETRTGQRGNTQSKALTTELRALKLLQDEPELRKPRMGGEFARKLGVSPATGRRLHKRLTVQQEPVSERSPTAPKGQDEEERTDG